MDAMAIPGTPVSLCPPADFQIKVESGGFRHVREAASIMVVEIPLPFEKAKEELTSDKLTVQAIELLTKDEITVKGLTGVLYKIRKPGTGENAIEQWVLLLPNGNTSVTINGTYLPKDREKFSSCIKKSILSSSIDLSTKADTALLPFEILVKNSALRLAKILQGPSGVYTVDGAWPPQTPDALSLFVGPSVPDPLLLHNKEVAISQLKQLCGNCRIHDDSVSAVVIDGLNGYEIVASSADNVRGVNILKYQVILFDGIRYFLLIGTSPDSHQQNLASFRETSRSFRKRRSV
jgi:hypothetical protein